MLIIKEKEALVKNLLEYNEYKFSNSEFEASIKQLKAEKTQLMDLVDTDWNQTKDLKIWFDKLGDARLKIGRKTLKVDKLDHNKNRINELEEQRKQNKVAYLELKECEETLDDITKRIKLLDDEMNLSKTRYVSNKTYLNALMEDIDTIKKNENEMELFGLYQSGLKAIPFIMISKVKDILDKKVNGFLSVITNFMIKFEIENTRIDIYLDRPVYNGKPILLNNASGFERFVSSLAIRLALLEISQLPKANFMAIDEGWNSFDYNNINNVRTIFEFLRNKFDFVISISHIQAIRQYCDTQINLSKNKDGFSVIDLPK